MLTATNAINYEYYCTFSSEAKGKHDVTAVANDLGVDLFVSFYLLAKSIRSLNLARLKSTVKRLIKYIFFRCHPPSN